MIRSCFDPLLRQLFCYLYKFAENGIENDRFATNLPTGRQGRKGTKL